MEYIPPLTRVDNLANAVLVKVLGCMYAFFLREKARPSCVLVISSKQTIHEGRTSEDIEISQEDHQQGELRLNCRSKPARRRRIPIPRP